MGITEGIKEILVVDDEPLIREIIIRKLSEFGYIATPVENAFEALNKMREKSYPLVLSDIMMPGMDGIELLKRLRSLYPDTAVVMITAVSNVNIAIEALREGAYDYLIKPFNFEEVVLSVKNAFERRDLILENRLYQKHLEALVENQTSEIRQLLSREQERSSELSKALEEIQITHDATIDALSAALDYRDNETEGHSQRVVRYSLEIGKVLGLERRNLEVLARGTLLHDIGKIGVPDSILWKPGKLTDEEWVEMRKHVEYGFKMLKSIHFLRDAALIVQHHHERYDGSGYPNRMSGDNIVIGARIFAIADTYDAMTTNRPYRKALTDRDAREEIKRCNGTQFDPKITEAFFQIPVEQWFNIKDDVDKQLRRYKERI